MKNILILVGGKSHSGKGIFSKNLEVILQNTKANIIRCSLSTYIRKIAKEDFFWDGVDTSTSRKFMGEVYRLGSEIYPYHMARRVWERDIIPCLNSSFNIIIVESFREVANYNYFKQLQDEKLIDKIITVNIVRPNFSDISEEQKIHVSEIDLDNFNFDYIIINDGIEKNLINKINMFVNNYLKIKPNEILQKEDLIVGNKVLITKIINPDKASHLVNYINRKGFVFSWIIKNNEKHYKILFPNGETSYFHRPELLKLED